MHAMDLVYSVSHAPTALLSHHIMSEDDLLVLAGFLSWEGQMKLWERGPRIAEEPYNRIPTRVKATLKLVSEIISDPWWLRAWPFQENVFSLESMKLLVRHASELEDIKTTIRIDGESFGTVPGEL